MVQGLAKAGGAPNDQWKAPTQVATIEWRRDALAPIADPQAGVALVELDLNHPHPAFAAIIRVDERGIWYSDGDGAADEPTWRLRLIPWLHVDGITLHQSS
jgi:hypothetical protein